MYLKTAQISTPHINGLYHLYDAHHGAGGSSYLPVAEREAVVFLAAYSLTFEQE
jgi:hypothetical protein